MGGRVCGGCHAGLHMALVLSGPDGGETLGRDHVSSSVVVVTVMLTMAVTLAIGLPGSIGLWLIAPFYPPWSLR